MSTRRLSEEDLHRILRRERRSQTGVTQHRELTPSEYAQMEAEVFGRDDERFWADYWQRKEVDDLIEVREAQRPLATVRTGRSSCPLCLRDIESAENCCPECGPYIDEDSYPRRWF